MKALGCFSRWLSMMCATLAVTVLSASTAAAQSEAPEPAAAGPAPAAAFAQDLPRIAAYVTGDAVGHDTKKALEAGLLGTFAKSGRFSGAENPDALWAKVEAERHTRPGGIADDSLVCELAGHFNIKYVCFVNVTLDEVWGFDFLLSTRIVNASEVRVMVSEESESPLKTADDIAGAADRIVRNLLAKRAARVRETQAPAVSAAEPDAVLAETAAVPPAQPQPPVPEPPPAAPPAAPESVEPVQPPPPAPQTASAAVEPKPAARLAPGFRFSVGAGGSFAAAFGGGLTWANPPVEQMTMPHNAGGGYLFVDVTYAEVSVGYSAGSGKWKSPNVSDVRNLPVLERSTLNVGVFAKYPIEGERLIMFPLLGIDYDYPISGNLKFAGGLAGETESGVDDLAVLWVKFGGGVDMWLGGGVYARLSALYGVRTYSALEDNYVKAVKNSLGHHDVETNIGHGLTIRLGVGVNF